MDAKKTGALISLLRKEKGMKQCELARKLGVTDKAISRWETGRGYPDVETLPKISKELDISIQELLEGERCADAETAVVETAVESVCQLVGQQHRKLNRKYKICLITVALLIFGLLMFWLTPYCISYYRSVVGTDRCEVASDYSSLTFCGKQYVPLSMNGYECSVGSCVVSEVQVEGMGVFEKLLFGDSLYEVKGVVDYEILYLQTEYDHAPSSYYVLESQHEKYQAMLMEGNYSYHYAKFACEDSCELQLRLDAGVADIFCATDEGYADFTRGSVDKWADILIYEENRIFYRFAGEVVCEGEAYYWCPSAYSEDEAGEYRIGYQYYAIPPEYNALLDSIFSFI